MARRKRYSYPDAELWVTKSNTSDVLSLKKGYPGFKSYRRLMGWYDFRSEREAKAKARAIFLRSCELIAEDMIDNGDVFLLPERETGVLFIGDPEAHGHEVEARHKLVEHELRSACGLVSLNRIFRRTIGCAAYRLTLLRPWLDRINDRIINHNMKYP